MNFKSFGLSDIGLSRPNNEDVWTSLPEIGFFALADGMGGHLAGEIAAKETIEHLSKKFHLLFAQRKSDNELIEEMREAIESANLWVYQMSRKSDEFTGMGTTLCCLYWTNDSVIYAHVGDSRIYRFRDEKLDLLTEDHSLFAKWLAMGKRAEECETPYPYKNVITRAIGTQLKANPEIVVASHQPNDLFLLCSDGLSDVIDAGEIKKVIEESPDLETIGERLIQMAKFKGSHDNITVLLIQSEEHSAKNIFGQQLDDSPRSESIQSDVGRS